MMHVSCPIFYPSFLERFKLIENSLLHIVRNYAQDLFYGLSSTADNFPYNGSFIQIKKQNFIFSCLLTTPEKKRNRLLIASFLFSRVHLEPI